MNDTRLTYFLAILVAIIWAASHIVEWFTPRYHVNSTVQAAMMAIITALVTKPVLCRVLKKNDEDC